MVDLAPTVVEHPDVDPTADVGQIMAQVLIQDHPSDTIEERINNATVVLTGNVTSGAPATLDALREPPVVERSDPTRQPRDYPPTLLDDHDRDRDHEPTSPGDTLRVVGISYYPDAGTKTPPTMSGALDPSEAVDPILHQRLRTVNTHVHPAGPGRADRSASRAATSPTPALPHPELVPPTTSHGTRRGPTHGDDQDDNDDDHDDDSDSASDAGPPPDQLRIATLLANLVIRPQSVVDEVPNETPLFRGLNINSESQHVNPSAETTPHTTPPTTTAHTVLSLREFLDEASTVPDVLHSRGLSVGQPLPRPTTAAERQHIFCGYRPHEKRNDRPLLDVTLDAPDHRHEYEIAFDIDSYIARVSSLAVARAGLNVLTVQRPTPCLTQGMHLGLFRVWYHDEDGTVSGQARLPVHQIPHLSIGRLASNDAFDLALVLPHAVRRHQEIAKLPDELFQTWMDDIFLPALHDVLPANLVRIFPASFEDAVNKSTIRFHNLLRPQGTQPRVQMLSYHIQARYLAPLWQAMRHRLRQCPEPRFEGAFLILNAKGIKSTTSSSTWSGMIARKEKVIHAQLRHEHVQTAWHDLGVEWTHPHSRVSERTMDGEVALWSLRYLNRVIDQIRRLFPDAPKSSFRQRDYNQYFLRDAGSCTLEPLGRHPLRKHGLLYAQWYNTVKDNFAAGDNYVGDNRSVADLGLDPTKLAAIQHVTQTVTTKQDTLIKCYLHIKKCITGLRDGVDRSFSLRGELRLREDLFDLVDESVTGVLEAARRGPQVTTRSRRQALKSRDLGQVQPAVPTRQRAGDAAPASTPTAALAPLYEPVAQAYLTLPTHSVMSWFQWNINRFCFGLEFIFASVPVSGVITWEQTRAVSMFFLGIVCFLGHLNHGEAARFWCDELPEPRRGPQPPVDRPQEGLGMLSCLEATGFPWFMNKLDWRALTFKHRLSDVMGFQRLDIERRLRRHAHEIMGVRDFSARIEAMQPLLVRFSPVDACRDLIYRLCFQICAHQFRRDVLRLMKDSIRPELHADVDAGAIPLCHRRLHAALRPRCSLKLRHRVNDKLRDWADLRRTIFSSHATPNVQSMAYWVPYRSALELVGRVCGAKAQEEWLRLYMIYIRATCWLMPYPSNNRLLNRDPGSDQRGAERPQSFVNVYHPAIERHLRRAPPGRPLALVPDWASQYQQGWTAHGKGMCTDGLILHRHRCHRPPLCP